MRFSPPPPSRLLLCAVWLLVSAIPASAQNTYYTEPGTYATRRESDPPAYVRNMEARLGSQWRWLDVGFEYRARFESRDDDIRRAVSHGRDSPLLRRTRGWLGAHSGVLGAAVEFTDSRMGNSHFAADNREVNKHELIQAYAELRFTDLLAADPRGNARPLSLRAGRQAFELLDRRLVSRNEWRNTTNSFDGLRASIGGDANDWQVELLALHPVTRLLDAEDERDSGQRFDGVIGHWRKFSPALTIEPFLLRLRQNTPQRDIHNTGLRVYGLLTPALNYDLSLLRQTGNAGTQQHKAAAVTAETGYTFAAHPWRPRFSVFYGYADGDSNPADTETNRFERFFGFGRAWSASEYFAFENLRTERVRLEFQPTSTLRADIGYSAYWLASATDRFPNLLAGSGNRDVRGASGNYAGGEFDARARFTVGTHTELTAGYTHFATGGFTRARQQIATGAYSDDSDFAYLELVWRPL